MNESSSSCIQADTIQVINGSDRLDGFISESIIPDVFNKQLGGSIH